MDPGFKHPIILPVKVMTKFSKSFHSNDFSLSIVDDFLNTKITMNWFFFQILTIFYAVFVPPVLLAESALKHVFLNPPPLCPSVCMSIWILFIYIALTCYQLVEICNLMICRILVYEREEKNSGPNTNI